MREINASQSVAFASRWRDWAPWVVFADLWFATTAWSQTSTPPLEGKTAAPAVAGKPEAGSPSASANIYTAGGDVRPERAIDGDLVAVGGRITVDKPVKGDAMLAGGNVDLRAAIGDDVRAAGGHLAIDSTIGGELAAVGGSISLSKNSKVAKAASLAAGDITLDGDIGGALDARAAKIYLNGAVAGNARLAGELIELGPQARVAGALTYSSRAPLKQAQGATIGGATTREEWGMERRDGHMGRGGSEWGWPGHMSMSGVGWGGAGWGGSVIKFLALLGAAALLLLVFPVFSTSASDRIQTTPW